MNPFHVYRILDVTPAMGDDELRAKHRALCRQYHPDREGGNAEAFVEVQQAYGMVRDAKARRALREKLKTLGDPCEECSGNGVVTIRRKFTVVGSEPCITCDRAGYIERRRRSTRA